MGARAGISLTAAFCAAVLAGCFGNEATAFPPGLEPLEENMAPRPAPVPDDDFPEQLVLVSGETDEYAWAHGRGYVHASAEDVWAAIRDPMVMADRRNTDAQTFQYDVEPEYDFSFIISYRVDEFVTVEWDELWRLGAIEGPLLAPSFGLARYQKIWGTQFITLLEGSITLLEIDADICEVQFIEHTKAVSTGPGRIEGSMTDRYANILAASHGDPLPQF